VALRLLPILLRRHLLHPLHHLPIQLLLDGDVRHGHKGGCAVPMLFFSSEPHDVARANFFNRASILLNPSQSRSYDQGLPERMRVPCRSCSRLKGHHGSSCPSGIIGLEQRIYANRAGEPIFGTFGGGLRTHSCYFHMTGLVFRRWQPTRSSCLDQLANLILNSAAAFFHRISSSLSSPNSNCLMNLR